MSHDEDLDDLVTPEELARASALTESELRAMDKVLLACVSNQWRKVARVVGTAMLEQTDRASGISDIIYSRRIRHLVEVGVLESQGNLARMRYSEVRLAQRGPNAT